MLFAIICNDKPDCLKLRMTVRPEHLAYLKAHEGIVKICGPMLQNDGKSCGSLLIVEMEDDKTVEDFIANDPYTKASLFESVIIKPFKMVGYEGKILEI